MMNEQSDFDAGHKAGMNAVLPLTPFEMSQYTDDFKVGYVVALAEIHSVRCASAFAAGGEAAEMGLKYHIPYGRLAPYFDDPENPEALDALRSGYSLDDDDDRPDDDV
jgi:hypothetical protein